MAKPRGKNAAASASKPEKDEETNNAPLTETEPEKTEVLAVATGAGENVDKENEDQEATDGDNTEQNVNEEEMEENENEEVLEDNKDGEKMEETTNKEKLEEKKNEDKTEGTNGDQVENTPGKKGRRPRNRKNKKGNQGAADAKPAEKSDKPESSSKETDGKKAESRGMIFLCSSKTKKDCYQYKLFGLPASKKDQVEKIYKGMRLFLFDLDKKLMYGIYKAAAPGGYNLEPKAFKAAFPAQVRFSVMEDCKPLHEEKFKAAIKKNYYGKNKFNTELDAEQVKNLCKLFKQSKVLGPKSKPVGKPIKQESRGVGKQERGGGRDRDRRQGQDRGRRLPFAGLREPYYREPVRAYERDPYASALAPPLPPRPVYVYDRPLEADYYRRPFEVEPRRDDYVYSDPYAYREPLPYREPGYPAGPPAGYYPY